ncbi:MAG TPA: translocation/assembly module TamB domain-containing protein [Candidatus Tumulicola sp.]|nr:translocation/assembly module TamB domain-containing protein [Candidatus Tumulicola sp.]
MARLRRFLWAVAIVAAVVCVLAAVVVTFQGPRSAFVGAALQTTLFLRGGFHLERGVIDVGSHRLTAGDVRIVDRFGGLLFAAKRITVDYDPRGLFGGGDRRFGVSRIELIEPVLRVVRLASGDYNTSPLFGQTNNGPKGPLPQNGSKGPLLHLSLRIVNGRIDFLNPTAFAKPGRAFSLTELQSFASIAQGQQSLGALTGRLVAGSNSTPITAKLVEKDRVGYAEIRIAARGVPVAPLVDYIASTSAFAVETGFADVELRGYALGYDANQGPQWQWSGVAPIRDGRIRFIPLIAPVRYISGRLRYSGDILTLDGVHGTAGGIPLRGSGGMRLLSGFRFALAVDADGALERAAKLFAFSIHKDARGRIRAHVRLDGPIDGIDVSGSFECPGIATLAGIPLRRIAGAFFYNNGHLAIQSLNAGYGAGQAYLEGDVDLAQAVPVGTFVAVGSLPSSQVPVVAGLVHHGRAETLALIEVTSNSLRGWGYAQVSDKRTSVRTMYDVARSAYVIGPAIARWPNGEIAFATTVDRLHTGRVLSAELVATHAPVSVDASDVRLPGLFGDAPVRTPAMAGTLDGVSVVRSGFDLGAADGLVRPKPGTQQTNASVLDLRARGVQVAGADLGDAKLRAVGKGSRFDIREASVHGRDATIVASGTVDLEPARGAYAAALEGVVSADLARIPLVSAARVTGRTQLRFDALLDGDRWAVAARSSNSNASIAGIPIGAANAVAARSGGKTTIAAALSAAGGDVALAGSSPASGNDTVGLWASGVNVADLQSLGVRLDRGQATVLGAIQAGRRGPGFTGAVALSDSSIQGLPLAAELDVNYAPANLAATGRVDLAGSRAVVSGNALGFTFGKDLSGATLDFNGSLHEGDLGRLVDHFLPASAAMTGSVASDFAIRGTLARPSLSGSLATSEGTLRGVAFGDLQTDVSVNGRVARLDNGRVRLGSSAFSFGGSLSPGQIDVRAASKAVDLSDFNDFFNGYDTLEGTGRGNVEFAVSPGRARASGSIGITATEIAGVPLGSVNVVFGGRRGSVLANVSQDGAIGSSSLNGSVRFANAATLLPDFSQATFDVSGRVSRLDLGIIAPLVRREDLGLSGKLDAAGSMQGSLKHPSAHANFTLHDGYVQKLQILVASGRVDSNGVITRLSGAQLSVPYADAGGDVTFGPGARIAGTAKINAKDLSRIAMLVQQPGALTGSAAATLAFSGTVARPYVSAGLRAGAGTAYGVAFDSLNGSASYAPGELSIGDTELVLAHRHGTLALSGSLPLKLQPLALGPARKAVNMRFTAAGIDLAAFDPLVGKNNSLGGILDVRVSAAGSAGAPDLAGSATLRNGSVKTSAQALTGVNADVALAQDTLTLQKFHGALGSGTVDARGAAHVVPAVGVRSVAGLSYWSHVTLHNASIDVPRWVSGTFDGDLSFTKSGATPYLSGNLTMRNATIPTSAIFALAQGFGQTSAPPEHTLIPGIPTLKPGQMVAYGGPLYPPGEHLITGETPQALPAPLFALPSIDLGLTTTAQNLRVRGGAIDLTGGGTLVIGGSIGAPTLAGTLEARRGQVSYFDTVFRLERGVVTFTPEEGLLPTLDVKAVTNASGQRIAVVVTGRLDNLNTDVSSEPPQSRDQIIAALLHGTQIESVLNGPADAQSQFVNLAQNYFTAELQRSVLFPFESALAQSLNIEEVAFNFDERGNLNLEVRKFVTPTVAAIYRSSLYSTYQSQAYGFAYALRDYASLEFLQTQGPTGLQSYKLDIRVTFR